MIRWLVKGAKALGKPPGRDDAHTKGAKKATRAIAKKVRDAPLRATVAAENALAESMRPRNIMVHETIGRKVHDALKRRAGSKVAIRMSGIRNPRKLVDRALNEGCDALIIRADDLKVARKARGRTRITLCAIGDQARRGKRNTAEDAAEILKGIAKAKPGTDVAHFMGQGPSIAISGKQWSLPDWAKALEPLANTLAKWTTGLGSALAAVGLGKDDLEAGYPGGFTGSSSEPMQQIGDGAEPVATRTTNNREANQEARPGEEHAIDRSPNTTAGAKNWAEWYTEPAAIEGERAEVKAKLAALKPTAKDAAAAGTIGMSITTPPKSMGRHSVLSGDRPSTRAPKQPPRKRKQPERER